MYFSNWLSKPYYQKAKPTIIRRHTRPDCNFKMQNKVLFICFLCLFAVNVVTFFHGWISYIKCFFLFYYGQFVHLEEKKKQQSGQLKGNTFRKDMSETAIVQIKQYVVWSVWHLSMDSNCKQSDYKFTYLHLQYNTRRNISLSKQTYVFFHILALPIV